MTERKPGNPGARTRVSDELKARVAKLWGEGMTTPKIAEAVGITKNAVVGIAHRAKLTARASPIRPRDPRVAAPPPKNPVAPKLADLSPLSVVIPETRATRGGRIVAATSGGASTRRMPLEGPTLPVEPVRAAVAVAPAGPGRRVRTCQFPTWPDQGRAPRPPTFYGAEAKAGPYCAMHGSLCFNDVRRAAAAFSVP